jgi:hypothetical protein
MTIHLHATDVPDPGSLGAWSEWTIDTGRQTVSPEHTKADAAIRGPALDLARWCWGRGGDVETFGDAAGAEAWRRSRAV